MQDDAAVSLVIFKDFHDSNHHEIDLEDKSLDLRDTRAYIRTAGQSCIEKALSPSTTRSHFATSLASIFVVFIHVSIGDSVHSFALVSFPIDSHSGTTSTIIFPVFAPS